MFILYTPSFHSVGNETLSVWTKGKIDIRARLAVPTYLLASRRDFQCLPTKVSLALGQCFKIHSSPQATLLTYKTFFDYFSPFHLHRSALNRTAADRARIPLKSHLISTPTNSHNFFILKHLKSLQHVSIQRS